MKKAWTYVPALALLVAAGAASAQDKSEERRAKTPVTPLKVQLVFTKLQGDRKVASLPYTLVCNADDNRKAIVRMGIEVPVPVGKDGAEFHYRNVGTNLDCSANRLDDGRFELWLGVEQSSVYSTLEDSVRRAGETGGEPRSGNWAMSGTLVANAPIFRSFNTQFSPILRDGQTAQYTAATDPVSGEVVKIEVTVNVVK
jgi:hypothetical protein